MKVPMTWLRELVELPGAATTASVAEMFTGLGLTVEAIEETGPTVSGPLVVGRVLSKTDEAQKNGKTIHYCRVDVGVEHNDPATDEVPASRGIVCGAHNFEPGDLVVVALPGCVLPGDFEISARKTYGHISDGMICSELELGLGEDHDGIMVLSAGPKPGDLATELLWSRDDVLTLDVTPDLGYCLSMRGLAREAAIMHGIDYADPYGLALPAESSAGYPVELLSDRCDVFVALMIEGMDPSAPSPRWLVDRLRASGVRSISLAVDVTNYVMLESGQPLHAYDGAKLNGPIRVRLAEEGEELRTLDGSLRKLAADDLLITDDSGPIGLAGVMGGESTEVTAATSTVVLEAAHFDAASISRTFRRHGLPSESSKRFEREVDPGVCYATARRAAELMAQHGGGTVKAEYTVVGQPPKPHRLRVRSELASQVLGAEVSQERIVQILTAGGVKVAAADGWLELAIPSWRSDLRDPYDIVEEVGRKIDYNSIELRLPRPVGGRGLTKAQLGRRTVMKAQADLGFTEVLSLPFISTQELDQLQLADDDPRREVVRLANPLADTQPFLRTSLLPGLFAAINRNTSRSLDDLALMERGLVYRAREAAVAPRPSVQTKPSEQTIAALDAALPDQPEYLAAVACGAWRPADWRGAAQPVDWTHAVAFAETAAASLGLSLQRKAAEKAPWHPGRCAELSCAGTVVGYAGELHPSVIKAYGLPERTCAVELNLGVLLAAESAVSVAALSSFPLAKEDVALIVDEQIPAETVRQALVDGAGELLESISLFDVYDGDQIEAGKKSLAFALRFRADRTLKDAEAAEARQAAVAMAEQRCGAVQRA